MVDLILKVIRAILRSLYMLFESVPALETLRRWFGVQGAEGVRSTALLVAGAAVTLGAAAFLLVLWVLSRGRRRGSPAWKGRAVEALRSPRGREG